MQTWHRLRGNLGLAYAIVAMLAFVILASAVRSGVSFPIDAWLLQSLRQPGDLSIPIGPRWLSNTMTDLTALGDVTVLTLVTVAACGYLIAARRYRTSLFIAAAAISGSILAAWLKTFVGRARPTIVPHLVDVQNLSFPSGHATNSAIIYLIIGLVLARSLQGRRVRAYVRGLAIAMTIILGITRVYLGVHFPTDVLAGWLIGSAWATLCWTVALRLERRHRIEAPAAA